MEDEIQNVLNVVVSKAEQSTNMRKTLKEKIYETVSTLRQLFAKIKISGDCKQQTPSIANTAEQNDRKPGLLEPTSVGLTPKVTGEGAQGVALPSAIGTDNMHQ